MFVLKPPAKKKYVFWSRDAQKSPALQPNSLLSKTIPAVLTVCDAVKCSSKAYDRHSVILNITECPKILIEIKLSVICNERSRNQSKNIFGFCLSFFCGFPSYIFFNCPLNGVWIVIAQTRKHLNIGLKQSDKSMVYIRHLTRYIWLSRRKTRHFYISSSSRYLNSTPHGHIITSRTGIMYFIQLCEFFFTLELEYESETRW